MMPSTAPPFAAGCWVGVGCPPRNSAFAGAGPGAGGRIASPPLRQLSHQRPSPPPLKLRETMAGDGKRGPQPMASAPGNSAKVPLAAPGPPREAGTLKKPESSGGSGGSSSHGAADASGRCELHAEVVGHVKSTSSSFASGVSKRVSRESAACISKKRAMAAAAADSKSLTSSASVTPSAVSWLGSVTWSCRRPAASARPPTSGASEGAPAQTPSASGANGPSSQVGSSSGSGGGGGGGRFTSDIAPNLGASRAEGSSRTGDFGSSSDASGVGGCSDGPRPAATALPTPSPEPV
mmetsp:Transcript_125457/g.360555  ORF Transcript_125457/g.360555 Transcript_125457/m.360555 type:complete len:294 (+) Transcript_125457:119-1000(+)